MALMASGITDSSLKFHLQNAKEHGVTQKEIAAIITHVAFYAGWPKGWAVFHMAKEAGADIYEIIPEDIYTSDDYYDAFRSYFYYCGKLFTKNKADIYSRNKDSMDFRQ